MGQKVGVLAAVLAVALAIVTITAHRTHTEAIMRKSAANDAWSHYQSTRVKYHNLELGESLIGVLGPRARLWTKPSPLTPPRRRIMRSEAKPSRPAPKSPTSPPRPPSIAPCVSTLARASSTRPGPEFPLLHFARRCFPPSAWPPASPEPLSPSPASCSDRPEPVGQTIVFCRLPSSNTLPNFDNQNF